MLVVDSSVWIDFFNDVDSPATELLHRDRDFTAIESRRGLHGWRH